MGLQYIELSTKSNFSFLRGASHPEELCEEAAKLKYSALGIADVNSLAGVVRTNVAAKKFNLKLIVGATLTPYINIPERNSVPDLETIHPEVLSFNWESNLEPVNLLVYPQSLAGYGSLSKLLTLGKSRAPKGCCFLHLEDIVENLKNSHCIIQLIDPNHEKILDHLATLRSAFGSKNLSLAIYNDYGPDNGPLMEKTIELGNRFDIKLVVVNNVLFHTSERKRLQNILTCIRQTIPIEEAGYTILPNAERHLKSSAEMVRLFNWLPDAIRRTEFIAEQVSGFSLDQLRYEYPREICPEDKTPLFYLKELTFAGLKGRYPKGAPSEVIDQIRNEFELIEKLNYAKYFLTVYDIVIFARSKGILCQGRGAAANSIICFCLGITSIGPDKINLLFERFISEERNEPPDIDVDFEHERREEVFQYIYEKYGRSRSALICAVITYHTKSAIREVGKVFSLSEEEIVSLSKALNRFDESLPLKDYLAELGIDFKNPRIR